MESLAPNSSEQRGSKDQRDFSRILKEQNGGRRSNEKPRDPLARHLSLGLVCSLAIKSGEVRLPHPGGELWFIAQAL